MTAIGNRLISKHFGEPRHLVVAVLMLTLSACQCAVGIRAAGSIAEGVRFEEVSASSGTTEEVRFLDVLVVEESIGPTPGPVWHISGTAMLSSVRYGEVPRGMKEIIPAKPLIEGRTYGVGISVAKRGVSIGSSGCRGAVRFRIEHDGKVVPCSEASQSCS